MKKDSSSNAQDAGHAEGQGRNIPQSGKKGKVNNSQTLDDMRDKSNKEEGNTPQRKQTNKDEEGDSGRS